MEDTTVAKIQIRPGLLDRLKKNSGIQDDEAYARLIGVSRTTLDRIRKGDEPGTRVLVGIAMAYGMSLGEFAKVVPEKTDDRAA
jgi:transcriptional regulator with XRE-family HTH domain